MTTVMGPGIRLPGKVPESENQIHSDEIARVYEFRAGLVPAVANSSTYLLHPAAVAWGRDFLEGGWESGVQAALS